MRLSSARNVRPLIAQNERFRQTIFERDALFDEQFPRYVRERSSQYWTPVAVAARAAGIFRARGAMRVLDVGCGPGKFCLVAGCLERELDIHGVEQRSRLVRLGSNLARRLNARNVRLSTGDVTAMPWDDYDGFYFFNPFSENVMRPSEQFDDKVPLSTLRFGTDLLLVESLLDQARPGTVLVTYFGLGGPIPDSYELVADECFGADRLRTWVQGPGGRASSAWLETVDRVISVSRSDMHCALASLIGDEPACPP
jgi:SAM-dependent methyltransferase